MRFELTILGSSSGVPFPNRFQTAQYLVAGGEHILLDCGEGTQMQLVRYGLGYGRIGHILISHLHADHYIGLIGLINTMNLNHRELPLHIYSPEGLEEIIQLQLKHSGVELRFEIIYHIVTGTEVQTVLETGRIVIQAIPLYHRLPVNGYIVREKPMLRNINKDKVDPGIPHQAFTTMKKGEDYFDPETGRTYKWEEFTIPPPKPRSYAFITDTLYNPVIVPFLENIDLLYHESTFMDDLVDYSKERYHSTNTEAARLALESRAGRLILGHFSTRYKELDTILVQAREIFPETYLGLEGCQFVIELKK